LISGGGCKKLIFFCPRRWGLKILNYSAAAAENFVKFSVLSTAAAQIFSKKSAAAAAQPLGLHL
jgi:hypothetical protein